MENENIEKTNPGPTSPLGKSISARNATKHGCCADSTLIIPGESSADLELFQETTFRSYKPRDAEEIHLIQEIIHADWFLQRATRALARVEATLYTNFPDPTEWTDLHHQSLTRFQRYQTTRTNHLAKCRRAFENYRKRREAEKLNEEKMRMAQQRLNNYLTRNPPPTTLEEDVKTLLLRKRAWLEANPHMKTDIPLVIPE